MDHGLARGLTNYGDRDFALYLRRSFARSMGYSTESLAKPVVGIANSGSGFNNCHRHFPQPMDAVVLVGGCDKTVPAQLMGAASANVPAIQLVAGPMMTGRWEGERLGACTDCRRFWGRYRAGQISKDEIDCVESRLATTAGTCAVMGTASTMACIAETLGMTLPGTAAIPAVHADRLRAAEATGEAAVRLAAERLTPDRILTTKAFENALRVLLAIGGSTNAIIHLTAIAGRAGVPISLTRLNVVSDETPVLVDLKPSGDFYMEDFFNAGGLGAVLAELRPQLHLDCLTVTGETLGARLDAAPRYVDHTVIRTRSEPILSVGGLVALFGTLAPGGAILKRSAADARLFETEAAAVVFDSLEDLSARVDDPTLAVTSESILVLKNAGPKGGPGMPEAGYLPIPQKLLRAGVKDMVRISDARMSGKERKLDLLVDEAELARRRAAWRPALVPERGYRKLYMDHVLQADLGCDFDFLRAAR